jgi:uncharacterized RDD family membrane protein YckC
MTHTRPQGLLGHYAGFASRFFALLIDAVVISVSLGALALTTSVIQSMLEMTTRIDVVNEWGIVSSLIQTLANPSPLLVSVLSILFFLIYHIFFLSTAGRTPGKAFMGLRVLTAGGTRLSVPRAFVRIIGYLFSALPIYVGFLLVLIDDRRQALHDKLAGTYVIYAWHARPDEHFLAREIQKLAHQEQQQ